MPNDTSKNDADELFYGLTMIRQSVSINKWLCLFHFHCGSERKLPFRVCKFTQKLWNLYVRLLQLEVGKNWFMIYNAGKLGSYFQ